MELEALQESTCLAPIVIFCYNRPDLIEATVNSLAANPESKHSQLYIFSDGNKGEKDQVAVTAVRQYINTISGFKSIEIVAAPANKGLANSVISGVSQVLEKHGKAIVLEDDLTLSSNFLAYMNHYLNYYEHEDKVFSISGYAFDFKKPENYTADIYFLSRASSWGWATWKNRWEAIDWQVKSYDEFSKNKIKRQEFAKGGSDLNAMLRKQMTGKLDSWAIRWTFHQYQQQLVSVFPVLSKVINNGFVAEATHTNGASGRYITQLDISDKRTFSSPLQVEITPYFQRKHQHKMGLWERGISKTKTIFKKMLG